jgi:hypothetical protein
MPGQGAAVVEVDPAPGLRAVEVVVVVPDTAPMVVVDELGIVEVVVVVATAGCVVSVSDDDRIVDVVLGAAGRVVVVVGGTVVVVAGGILMAPGTRKSPLEVCTTSPVVGVFTGGLK